MVYLFRLIQYRLLVELLGRFQFLQLRYRMHLVKECLMHLGIKLLHRTFFQILDGLLYLYGNQVRSRSF